MRRRTMATGALLAATALAGWRAAGPVDALAWMAGCWRGDGARSTYEEQWMAPRGGSMLGMSRTTRGDTAMVGFEFIAIVERDGRAVYRARPEGQPPAEFTSTFISDTMALFENPAHDFPQRVRYRRVAPDSLIAAIEGDRDGRTRRIPYPMRAVPCGRG